MEQDIIITSENNNVENTLKTHISVWQYSHNQKYEISVHEIPLHEFKNISGKRRTIKRSRHKNTYFHTKEFLGITFYSVYFQKNK